MEEIKVENVRIEVGPHSSGRDYSTLTLYATINDRPCKQAISVYSKFIFDCADESYRETLISDVVTKLSYDLIMSSYLGFGDKIKANCNIKDILGQMNDLITDE